MSAEHHYIRTTLIGGVLVVLPLFVFVNLVLWFGTWAIDEMEPVAHLFAGYLVLPMWVGHALTVAVMLGGCFVIGAIVSTRLGNRAFNWLEQAVNEGASWLTMFGKSDPRLDPLRSDPRFVDVLRRMRLDR